MSFLLPLEPEGQGTTDVESMASFFSRLATLHHASPYQLGNILREETGIPGFGKAKNARCSGRNSLSANGFGSPATATLNWVSAGLDNSNLAPLTFKVFEHVLPHSGWGILRNYRAWCPDCILESRARGQPDYEKLHWALAETTRCPIHHRALEFECPVCGTKPEWYRVKAEIMACPFCRADLVSNQQAPHIDSATDQFEQHVLSVIEFSAKNPGYQYPERSAHNFVLAYEALAVQQNCAPSYRLSEHGIAVWQFEKQQEYRPSLRTLCDIADAAGVPLSLMLESPRDAAKVLCLSPKLRKKRSIRPRQFRARTARKAVLAEIARQLAKPLDEEPTALKNICESFGISTSYAYCHFKHQSNALVARRAEWEAKRQSIRNNLARRIIDDEGLPLFVSGQMSSQKKIVHYLAQKHSIQKTALRNELKAAVDDWQQFRHQRAIELPAHHPLPALPEISHDNDD